MDEHQTEGGDVDEDPSAAESPDMKRMKGDSDRLEMGIIRGCTD